MTYRSQLTPEQALCMLDMHSGVEDASIYELITEDEDTQNDQE